MRRIFLWAVTASVVANIAFYFLWPIGLWSLAVLVPVAVLGVVDMTQKRQAIRRNFPVIGHFRYLLEEIRPEIQQYFIETNRDGMPFSRERRSVIYQRAKKELDTVPFGTQWDVYEPGYEWINHSIAPKPILHDPPRVLVGGPQCKKPYSASLYNISAMSYGSLSNAAIRALNLGAKKGGFAHNTGEGGISPYHIEYGGDLIWQLGTGYFSARSADGGLDYDKFKDRSQHDSIKMIEIKLSQGAKPGHGGILPARKVTKEISEIRGVPVGQDVLSPPYHKAFSTPTGLLETVARLRELSGGKPVGFKLCLGKRREFFAITKAMLKTGITPDFISVDGAEGGTGAAPLEFSNSIGTPLNDGLIFVHNALVGTGLRKRIKVIAAGKISTGFNIAQKIALGADMCSAARGMMFALGCIQALRCNNNTCPTGVATQDPELIKGLIVPDKADRVASFHKATIHSFLEVLAACGLSHPDDLEPWHIQRRVDVARVQHYGEIYDYLTDGILLGNDVPESYRHAWQHSKADVF